MPAPTSCLQGSFPSPSLRLSLLIAACSPCSLAKPHYLFSFLDHCHHVWGHMYRSGGQRITCGVISAFMLLQKWDLGCQTCRASAADSHWPALLLCALNNCLLRHCLPWSKKESQDLSRGDEGHLFCQERWSQVVALKLISFLGEIRG